MKKKNVIFICVLTAITFSLMSFFITSFILKSSDNGRVYVEKDEYNQLMRFFELKTISETVGEEYYVEVDGENLIKGALEGSVDILGDGYSRYYSEEDFAWFDGTEESTYIGQGMMLGRDAKTGYFKVTKVFADTPAYKANILVGDTITAIDGRDVREIDLENAVSRLRGQSGTKIELSVIAEDSDEEITISFVRNASEYGLIYGDMLTSSVGYITVAEFGRDSAEELEGVIKELQENGASKLIIDLRDVPGGYIASAASCADLFISTGVIAQQYDREGVNAQWEAKQSVKWTKPVYILTNEKTAGCAEVFAAALQKNISAIVIGGKTAARAYTGKYISLGVEGDGLRLRTGGYLAPDGTDLAKEGVTPDEKVKISKESDEDEILKTALKICG